MRRVCERYDKAVADPRLATVANAFLKLQSARRVWDYDLDETLESVEGKRLVQLGVQAIAIWSEIERNIESKAFLASLLIGDRGIRRG